MNNTLDFTDSLVFSGLNGGMLNTIGSHFKSLRMFGQLGESNKNYTSHNKKSYKVSQVGKNLCVDFRLLLEKERKNGGDIQWIEEAIYDSSIFILVGSENIVNTIEIPPLR